MNTEQCTEITDNSTPLRQGDILFFPKRGENEKYGIVVTGDCDIAQKKCRRIISYCIITTAKYYIATELMYYDFILRESSKLEESVLKNVCSLLEAERSESFLSTLLSLEPSDLRNLLKDEENLLRKIEILKSMKGKTEYSMTDYIDIYKINNNVNDIDLEKIKSKFLSKLNSLPGDKYYITEIPNQNNNLGVDLYLPYIFSLSKSLLLLSIAQTISANFLAAAIMDLPLPLCVFI